MHTRVSVTHIKLCPHSCICKLLADTHTHIQMSGSYLVLPRQHCDTLNSRKYHRILIFAAIIMQCCYSLTATVGPDSGLIFNSINLYFKWFSLCITRTLLHCESLTAWDQLEKFSTSETEKTLLSHSTFSFSFFLGNRLYLTIAASCSTGDEREGMRIKCNCNCRLQYWMW